MTLAEFIMPSEDSSDLRQGPTRLWLYQVTHYSWLDDLTDALAMIGLFFPAFGSWILFVITIGASVSFVVSPRPWPRRLIGCKAVMYGLAFASLLAGVFAIGLVSVVIGVVGVATCWLHKWAPHIGGRIVVASFVIPVGTWAILWYSLHKT